MPLLSRMRSTVGAALGRRRFEDDLSTELQFHVDAYAEDLIRAGVSPVEARRRARLEFGSAEAVKEEARAARGQRLLDELSQDIRYALRRLGRSRVPAIVAVLALGVGLNSAVFGVIHAALLRPLPHPDADRLVAISSRSLKVGREHLTASLDFFDIERQARSFARVAAYYPPGFTLTGGEQAERVSGARASSGIFDVFGVRPALGRGFLPAEDRAGAAPVAVISHELWTRRFRADPRAIGQAILLSGRSYTLVGVLPEGFHSPAMWPRMPEVWVPIGLDANVGRRDARMLRVLGRLVPGATVDGARAELTVLGDALARQHPESNADTRLSVTSLHEQLTRDVRPSLYALAAAALALLLVACGNAAGLLIGGALERRHEFATRLALGASRARIVRQIVAENLIVGLLAAAAGFALAFWAQDFLIGTATAAGVPRAADISLGPLTFALAALVSLACTFACALATAAEATRPVDLRIARGAGTSTARRGLGRAALISAEAAVSLALLVGAALLVRSFLALQGTDPGFDPTRVVTMRLSAPAARYPAGPVLAAFYDRVVERVQALPGVDRASVVDWLPASGFGASMGFRPAGTQPAGDQHQMAELRVVGLDYFQTVGVPVVAGRSFDRRDVDGAVPVVTINAAMARAHFGSTNPIGQRLTVDHGGSFDVEIVGVVGDVRELGLRVAPSPGIYAPKTQQPWTRHETRDLVVRTRGDLASLGPAIQAVLRELEPDVPLTPVQTMDEVVGGALKRPRFYAAGLAVFAGCAVLLAAFGIYGAVTSAVAVRRRELGVRLALGATRPNVLWQAASSGAGPTLIGLAAGIPLALLAGRLLRDQLYGVTPMDVATLVAVAGFMAAVTLVAAVTPAIRATRIDPVVVLKHEAGA
jgi:putative ABC transport system permease protein